MNIVILHCHYERGGVTQVVENHVRSLCKQLDVQRIMLVSGSRIGGLSAKTTDVAQQLIIDRFDYDSERSPDAPLDQRSQRIADDLIAGLGSSGIGPEEAVLHWHNHSLGKNTAAPQVIRILAQRGYRLLLHVHDFAEDTRPENYARLIGALGASDRAEVDRYLYPVASQIHYCTLTKADADGLIRLGIPPDRVACLPNSVIAPPAESASLAGDDSGATSSRESLELVRRLFRLSSQARWCLYPVRGIRRKNVGELLLVSLLDPSDRYFGLTLCPTTPIERRSYQRWRKLAEEIAPRVVFNAGQHPELSFHNNLMAADFVVSTSVAEGFGMAFLEPWLLGREVIARRLTHVTNDFEAQGMRLAKFYDSIPIPGSQPWVAECGRRYTQEAANAWARLPEAFRMLPPPRLPDSDCVDFAHLVPSEQAAVLKRVSCDAGFRQDVLDHSANLVQYIRTPCDRETVAFNAAVVREKYSPSNVTKQLMSLYEKLLLASTDDRVDSPADAGHALELINLARPFYPCRTEEIAGE